jgi:hypothetical protein
MALDAILAEFFATQRTKADFLQCRFTLQNVTLGDEAYDAQEIVPPPDLKKIGLCDVRLGAYADAQRSQTRARREPDTSGSGLCSDIDRDNLSHFQPIDCGAHDAACIACAFSCGIQAARVDGLVAQRMRIMPLSIGSAAAF